MKGRLTNLTRGLNGEYQLTISTRDKAVVDVWNDLHEVDINAEVKRFYRKRSRDANAYAWVLIDKLAAALNITKTEVYRESIRNIGGVSDTCCVVDKAVQGLIDGWAHNGLGWFAETKPSKIAGCTNVILYYGSSTYNTKQMSALIDVLVQECKAQHIETLPPHELEAMAEALVGRNGRTKTGERPRT